MWLVVLTAAPALRWKIRRCLKVSPLFPWQTTENLLGLLPPSLKGQTASQCLFSPKRENRGPGILQCVEPQVNSCCTIRFIQLRTINCPPSVPTLEKGQSLANLIIVFLWLRTCLPWLRYCRYHVHTQGEILICDTVRYEPDFPEASAYSYAA